MVEHTKVHRMIGTSRCAWIGLSHVLVDQSWGRFSMYFWPWDFLGWFTIQLLELDTMSFTIKKLARCSTKREKLRSLWFQTSKMQIGIITVRLLWPVNINVKYTKHVIRHYVYSMYIYTMYMTMYMYICIVLDLCYVYKYQQMCRSIIDYIYIT